MISSKDNLMKTIKIRRNLSMIPLKIVERKAVNQTMTMELVVKKKSQRKRILEVGQNLVAGKTKAVKSTRVKR